MTWFRAAMRYSVRGHAAAMVCVSESTAARLRDVLSPRLSCDGGGPRRRPCPFHRRGARARTTARSRELSAWSGRTCCTSGPWSPRKGVGDLVTAFDLLAQAHPEVNLRPCRRRRLESRRHPAGDHGRSGGRAGPPARLRVRGQRPVASPPGPRVAGYRLARGRLGLPALEAMAAARARDDLGRRPWRSCAGSSALLVPPGWSQRALAAAMETALAAEGSPEAAGRRASGSTAARYTWEACADGHLEVYRRAAGD